MEYLRPKPYLTDQVIAQFNIAHRLDDTGSRTQAMRLAEEMLEKNEAGIKRAPAWAQQRIKEFDKALWWRFDFDRQQFALDRYDPTTRCFRTITYWLDTLTQKDVADAIHLCQRGDMQRVGAEEYRLQKEREAQQIIKQNENKGDEAVLAAVDSLTDRQVEEFIKVEQALHTGEKIRPGGEDAKTLLTMMEAGKNAPPPPKTKPRSPRRRK